MTEVACEQTDEEETGQLSIAQMVQHCSANAEALSSIPLKSLFLLLLLGYLKDSNAAAHSVDTALVRQWDLKESKMTLNVLFTCWKVLE